MLQRRVAAAALVSVIAPVRPVRWAGFAAVLQVDKEAEVVCTLGLLTEVLRRWGQ
jgi:hypothetical protein